MDCEPTECKNWICFNRHNKNIPDITGRINNVYIACAPKGAHMFFLPSWIHTQLKAKMPVCFPI